jgi:hypothetical protein
VRKLRNLRVNAMIATFSLDLLGLQEYNPNARPGFAPLARQVW